MSKELRIKKGEVEIAIRFETKEQLEEQLNDYDEIVDIVKNKLGVNFESKKTIRKDLEGICDYDDNQIVLIKSPSSKLKKVCLVLYAYGPSGTTLTEITLSSGVTNPSRNVINNTGGKQYFRLIGKNKYALSDKGISYVTETILPELKGEKDNGSN